MTFGGLGLEIVEQALLLPAIVAAALALALVWLFHDRAPSAAVAITVGFVAAFEPIRGLDLALPRAASDKLPWLALLGLAAAGLSVRRHRPLAAALVVTLGAVGAVAAREIAAGRIAGPFVVALGGLAVWQAVRRQHGPPWRRHWTLAAIAFAFAGIALFARTVLVAELALACGTALLGSAARPSPSPEGLLPGLAVLVGLATTLALFSVAPPQALALAGAIAGAAWLSLPIARRLRLPEPALFTGIGIAVALLAAGVSRWSEGSPLYYG